MPSEWNQSRDMAGSPRSMLWLDRVSATLGEMHSCPLIAGATREVTAEYLF